MRDRKWAIVVPMLFCFLITSVSIGLCAQQLKQKSAAAHTGAKIAADLSISSVYLDEGCRMHVKVTNVGEIAILNTYDIRVTKVNEKPHGDFRLPVNLEPMASKEFTFPAFIVGIDTLKIEIYPDPMRSTQPDLNTSDKTVIKTLTCQRASCPDGFERDHLSSKKDFMCVRRKSAAPCPQGYHVIWGSCTPAGQEKAAASPQCSFSCIPANPDVTYDCGTNQSISTPCYAGCSKNTGEFPK